MYNLMFLKPTSSMLIHSLHSYILSKKVNMLMLFVYLIAILGRSLNSCVILSVSSFVYSNGVDECTIHNIIGSSIRVWWKKHPDVVRGTNSRKRNI